MQIHHVSKKPSILNQFLYEIRDKSIQSDSLRFRRNIERIGEILGYELSKHLHFSDRTIETPLAETKVKILKDSLVLCSILRAGIPLHNGLLNIFDKAENAFVSAYRKIVNSSSHFEIVTNYVASPNLNGKTLILSDPMLATGQSLLATLDSLKAYGTPKVIHVVCVIASQEGIDEISCKLPSDVHLWVADIDPTLNEKSYIVPGLGDAGDLSYGVKV